MNTDMFYHTLPPDEQPKWDQAKNLLEKIQKNQLPACLGHVLFHNPDDVRLLRVLKAFEKSIF